MKLRKWCEKQGISYLTGLNWFHAGIIPNSRQMNTGTIMIDDEENKKIIVINKDEKDVVKNLISIITSLNKDEIQQIKEVLK